MWAFTSPPPWPGYEVVWHKKRAAEGRPFFYSCISNLFARIPFLCGIIRAGFTSFAGPSFDDAIATAPQASVIDTTGRFIIFDVTAITSDAAGSEFFTCAFGGGFFGAIDGAVFVGTAYVSGARPSLVFTVYTNFCSGVVGSACAMFVFFCAGFAGISAVIAGDAATAVAVVADGAFLIGSTDALGRIKIESFGFFVTEIHVSVRAADGVSGAGFLSCDVGRNFGGTGVVIAGDAATAVAVGTYGAFLIGSADALGRIKIESFGFFVTEIHISVRAADGAGAGFLSFDVGRNFGGNDDGLARAVFTCGAGAAGGTGDPFAADATHRHATRVAIFSAFGAGGAVGGALTGEGVA